MPNPEVNHHLAIAFRVAGLLRSPTFSVLAGIIAPTVCFALERMLFSDIPDTLPGSQFIDFFPLFGYGIIGLEMLVLAVWLKFGDRLGTWNALVAGVLFVGALVAGGIGLWLLPLSLIGLLVLIGLLGFVPFLTAAVYCMNAVEAYRRAGAVTVGARLTSLVLAGAILVIGVPGSVQTWALMAASSAVGKVIAGDPMAVTKLPLWCRHTAANGLIWSYASEEDPVRKQRLADAYKALTGGDVETALARLMD